MDLFNFCFVWTQSYILFSPDMWHPVQQFLDIFSVNVLYFCVTAIFASFHGDFVLLIFPLKAFLWNKFSSMSVEQVEQYLVTYNFRVESLSLFPPDIMWDPVQQFLDTKVLNIFLHSVFPSFHIFFCYSNGADSFSHWLYLQFFFLNLLYSIHYWLGYILILFFPYTPSSTNSRHSVYYDSTKLLDWLVWLFSDHLL